MKDNLKIAIYSGEIPSTTFIERLIEGLSNKNIEILLFGHCKKHINYSVTIQNKGYGSGKIRKGYYLLKYSLLLGLLKRKEKKKLDAILLSNFRNGLYDKVKYYPVLWHKPDIFHVQWAKGLDHWMWVKEFGIKLVLSLRGAHINYSPIADAQLAEMYKRNFPKVDAFHAVSYNIAEEAKKYGARSEKIKVVYSGLNLDDFSNSKKESQTGFHIISVGRPHWIKGYVYALDACKILKNLNIDFTYTIIGGTNLELIYQIKELELDNNVTLMDHVPFERAQELMQKSDVLLLSSIEEGVANVVLEAMAQNTLVLTTNCGGMTEVVVDGENGFVVPVRDSKSIAEAIIKVTQLTAAEKTKIVRNANQTIAEQHTKDQMISGMFDLYKDLKTI